MSKNNPAEPLDPGMTPDAEGTTTTGGPDSALGSGVESALTGNDAESSDEGRSGSTPEADGSED
jgi:hypothetical protein